MRKLGKRTASFLRSPWMALVPALAIVLGLERKASEGESGWWLSHRTARLGDWDGAPPCSAVACFRP